MIKQLILKILKQSGYRLVKANNHDNGVDVYESVTSVESLNTMSKAIDRLTKIYKPDLILDLGAARGEWTEMTQKFWPEAKYFLIEPISEQIGKMSDALRNSPDVKIIEAVAGKEHGIETLTITDDLDGSGVYGESGGNIRKVPVISVDDLIVKSKGSVLLKLDTHGFEIPIFEGAKQTLKRTHAIIVEVYGFHVSPTGKLFHEISEYLEERGFRLFDLVDIMRRPKDNAFWQADAVYLKKSNPVFINKSYI